MRKKLLSLALVLAMALSLAPAALAAGQFTDVPDTSPFAAPIAWAVEKDITKGTTPTTFGPKNTCTTSHILTFLWRANGRPGDVGDEKAAVTAWANGLDIDTSDLAAPCTRANAVTYMWKAAGSPAPAQTASFTDVAADAPYASAVSWAVEKGVTKGTSDTAFSPYDTCTRGQIVTFLCRQLDPEAAKAQPAPAQPEKPAPQPDSPEAVLAAIQGVWREESTGGISERWIEGNTFTMATLSTTSSSNLLVSSSTSFTLEGPTENGEYELRSSEGVLHQIRGAEGKAPSTAELSSGSDALLKVKKSSSSGEWIVYNTGLADTVYNFSRASESLLAEKLKALQDQADQQAAAISKYATYADFPGVPDLGAIYDVPVNNIVTSATGGGKSFYYSFSALGERGQELFPNFSGSIEGAYRKILEECGFTLTSTMRAPNSILDNHWYRGNGYTVLVGFSIPTTKYVSDYLYIHVMPNT